MTTEVANRLRAHFTTVQITLLSIVVALVLENLLGRIDSLPHLNFSSSAGWLTWSQIALVVSCAIATWAGFGLTLGLPQKLPRIIDFLAPFALLIAMQTAVRYLHPDSQSVFLSAIGTGVAIAALQLYIEWRNQEVPLRSFAAQAALATWLLAGAAVHTVIDVPIGLTLAFIATAALFQVAAVFGILFMWQASTRALAGDTDTSQQNAGK